MRVLSIILLIYFLTITRSLLAADTNDCIKINDDTKRLVCFDKIYSSSNVIAYFEGSGFEYTLPFIANNGFEIHWKYKQDEEPQNILPMFVITIMNENAEAVVDSVMNTEAIESGVSYYPKKGKYYLGVAGAGSWSVTIISSD
jgi:hypothetical protein